MKTIIFCIEYKGRIFVEMTIHYAEVFKLILWETFDAIGMIWRRKTCKKKKDKCLKMWNSHRCILSFWMLIFFVCFQCMRMFMRYKHTQKHMHAHHCLELACLLANWFHVFLYVKYHAINYPPGRDLYPFEHGMMIGPLLVLFLVLIFLNNNRGDSTN